MQVLQILHASQRHDQLFEATAVLASKRVRSKGEREWAHTWGLAGPDEGGDWLYLVKVPNPAQPNMLTTVVDKLHEACVTAVLRGNVSENTNETVDPVSYELTRQLWCTSPLASACNGCPESRLQGVTHRLPAVICRPTWYRAAFAFENAHAYYREFVGGAPLPDGVRQTWDAFEGICAGAGPHAHNASGVTWSKKLRRALQRDYGGSPATET